MTLDPIETNRFYLRVKKAETQQDVDNAIKLLCHHCNDIVIVGTLCKKEKIDLLCSFTSKPLTDEEKRHILNNSRKAHAAKLKEMKTQTEAVGQKTEPPSSRP